MQSIPSTHCLLAMPDTAQTLLRLNIAVYAMLALLTLLRMVCYQMSNFFYGMSERQRLQRRI